MLRNIALVLSQMSVEILGEAAAPGAVDSVDLGMFTLHVGPHVLAYIVAVRALGQLMLVMHIADVDPEVLAHYTTMGTHLLLRFLLFL